MSAYIPVNKNTDSDFTILVVEDEELNYMFMKTVFETISEYSIKVIRAINGQEAVDIFNNNYSIDLVLVDIHILGMNVLTAISTIKKMNSSMPVVAEIAYLTEAKKQKAIDSGCSEFITRPITGETLVEVVTKYRIQKTTGMSN